MSTDSFSLADIFIQQDLRVKTTSHRCWVNVNVMAMSLGAYVEKTEKTENRTNESRRYVL